MTSANEDLNRVFGRLMRNAGLGSQMPRWRAYSHGSIWFCWNTEPFTVSKDQPRPWAAWQYRHNKQKGTYKRVGKTLWFASRKKAKARADKWCTLASQKSTARKAKALKATLTENDKDFVRIEAVQEQEDFEAQAQQEPELYPDDRGGSDIYDNSPAESTGMFWGGQH